MNRDEGPIMWQTQPAPEPRRDGDTFDPAGEGCTVDEAYRRYAGDLRRRVGAMTRDTAVADDVVHESFVRLLGEHRRGRPPVNARAWLHRVAANLVATRARRAAVAERHAGRVPGSDLVASPEAAAIESETSGVLREALAMLPAVDRRAVLLAAHGYPGPEIAHLLGRSDGATRTLLCRARARLRSHLIEAGAV